MDQTISPKTPMRLLVPLLLLVAAVHAVSLDRPFFSDDYAIIAQVERKGVGVALEHAFTRKYLDAMLDFYRPVAASVFTVQIAVFSTWETGYHLVTLLLLLGCALLQDRIARQLGVHDRALRALALLAVFAGPVWVESLSWTIAGQQDVVAVFFMLAATTAFLSGSFSSLLFALGAYGSKEFAFVTAPLLACLFARRLPERKLRGALLLGLHFAILAAFLYRHAQVIGGVELPYQQEYGDSLAIRLSNALQHLPTALQAGLGWSGVALLFLAILFAAKDSKRSRRAATIFAASLPIVMFLGPALPLLLMPLDSIRFGENTRMLVLCGTVLALILPLALARIPRIPALLALLAVIATGAYESQQLHAHWAGWGQETRNCIGDIAALPGDHLLVARLPGMLSEAYPAAQLPPFRTPGRPVFPLRLAKTARDVIPIRPATRGVGIAIVQPDGHVRLMGQPSDVPANSTVKIFEKNPGVLHLRGLPAKIESLGSIVFTATDPVGGLHRVEMRTRLPGAKEEQTWHCEFPPAAGLQRFLFCDVPVWPEAELVGFRILGATSGMIAPALPGTLKIAHPKPGTRLSANDVTTPFQLENLDQRVKALQVTLHTPGGATFPIIVPGRNFSFLQLFALGGEYFRFSIDFGVRRGSDTVLISVSALLDPQNLNSVHDRTPPTPYTLQLPK